MVAAAIEVLKASLSPMVRWRFVEFMTCLYRATAVTTKPRHPIRCVHIFIFQTRVELILWRVSSLISTGTTVFFWVFETIAARRRFGRWYKYLLWIGLKKLPSKPVTDIEVSRASHGDISPLDAFEKEQKQAKPILMWEVGLIFQSSSFMVL
jgi:hypothetical protein